MADLKVALQDLKEESDSGRLAEKTIPARKPRRLWIAACVTVLVLLAGAGVGWWWWNSQGLLPVTMGTNFAPAYFRFG